MAVPQRTIYVGLGGTGKDILIRVRRWMFERWRVTSLPFTRFVWMDTDVSGRMPTDIQDVITRHVDFSPQEKIGMAMEPGDIKNYMTGAQAFGLGPECTHPRDWLDRRLEKRVQALRNGAGQIRCFGRLAFWHKAKEFAAAIKRAQDDLSDWNSLDALLRREYEFDGLSPDPVQVVVVAGLAGGTGSGAFIDAGVLLRNLVRGNLRAILVQPTVFTNMRIDADPHVLNANAYAALMELDYVLTHRANREPEKYAFPGFDHPVEVVAPVYDIVWLVDCKRATRAGDTAGTGFADPREPFRVASDVLSLELDKTAFAQQLRSQQSNAVQAIVEDLPLEIQNPSNGEVLYTILCHNRYAAFGQAQVVLDRDRLRNAAAYRLGEEMLRFMRRKPGDTQKLVGPMQDTLQNDQRIGFTEALIRRALMVDNKGLSIVEQWKTRVGKECAAIEEPLLQELKQLEGKSPLRSVSRMDAVIAEVERGYEKLERDLTAEANTELSSAGVPSTWGPHYKAIQRNVEAAVALFKERIEAEFLTMLTDPVHRGMPAAHTLIDLATEHAQRLLDQPSSPPELSAPDKPRVTGGKTISRAKARVAEAKLLPGLIYPFKQIALNVTRDALSRAVRSEVKPIKRDVDAFMTAWHSHVENTLLLKYEETVRPLVTKVISEVQQWLGEESKVKNDAGELVSQRTGLRHRFATYEDRLRKLQERQKIMADAFRNAERGARNQYVDTELEEGDLLFRSLLGRAQTDPEPSEDDRRGALVKAMKAFFTKSKLVSSDLVAKLTDAAEEQTFDVVVEGMKELVRRAERADANPAAWNGEQAGSVQSHLERFCFEATEELAGDANLNAASQLTKRSEEELAIANREVAANSYPTLVRRHDWQNLPRRQSLIVGASAAHTETVRGWLQSADLAVEPPQMATNERGNIVIYQDFYAMPIVQVGGLREMKTAYLTEIRKGGQVGQEGAIKPLLRHSDCRWRRYPDIVIPRELVYWQERNRKLRLFLQAAMLGAVEYDLQTEEWVLQYMLAGVIQRENLGGTIDIVLDHLGEETRRSEEALNRLEAKISDQHAKLEHPDYARVLPAYAAAARHLRMKVYPSVGGAMSPEQKVAVELFLDTAWDRLARAQGMGNLSGKEQELRPELAALLEDGEQMLVEIDYMDHRMSAKLKRIAG